MDLRISNDVLVGPVNGLIYASSFTAASFSAALSYLEHFTHFLILWKKERASQHDVLS